MNTGIIYLLTTPITGIVKIGKTGSENYKERIRNLEKNGYSNFNGLKQVFAIELEDYNEKEKLLHELFNKQRIADSEFFALDIDLLKQLLLAFEGKVVFPLGLDKVAKESEFEKVTKKIEKEKGIRIEVEKFSLYKKGIKNGDILTFKDDKTKQAIVVGEREVEFEGEIYKLSPLVRKWYSEMDRLNSSGAYQGAAYLVFNYTILTKLPNIQD